MTVHRAWRHYNGATNEAGVLMVSAEAITGDVHVSGFGYAELRNASGSNEASTETSGASVNPFVPVVGQWSSYDSGLNKTFFYVVFAAAPGTRIITHVFSSWEA